VSNRNIMELFSIPFNIEPNNTILYMELYWLKAKLLWLIAETAFSAVVLLSAILACFLLPYQKKLKLNFYLTIYLFVAFFIITGWLTTILFLVLIPIYIRRSDGEKRRVLLIKPLINIFSDKGVKWYFITK
jgi:hypothetical protein